MIHEALIAESITSNSTYLPSHHSSPLSQLTSHPTYHPNYRPTDDLQPDLTYLFDDVLFTDESNLYTKNPAMQRDTGYSSFQLITWYRYGADEDPWIIEFWGKMRGQYVDDLASNAIIKYVMDANVRYTQHAILSTVEQLHAKLNQQRIREDGSTAHLTPKEPSELHDNRPRRARVENSPVFDV